MKPKPTITWVFSLDQFYLWFSISLYSFIVLFSQAFKCPLEKKWQIFQQITKIITHNSIMG